MPYNLAAPNGLLAPVDLANTERWFDSESSQIEPESLRLVLHHVTSNLNDFVRWPARAMLLWEGCDRITPEGEKHRYHRYPESVCQLAKSKRVTLDGRPNGPAIAAFVLAGGDRPARFGSTNGWPIHHLYSGKFPYIDQTTTTHAIKKPLHFTQSAGLIAAHPVADVLCDEFPSFAWLLRAESFRRFGYDPDSVFSPSPDRMGFAYGHACEITV